MVSQKKKSQAKQVSKVKKPAMNEKQKLAVAIAKDVIKHLKQTKITNNGYYCVGAVKEGTIAKTDQVQKHIPTLRKKCEVCAKGALFLSYVDLKNEITFGQHHLFNEYEYGFGNSEIETIHFGNGTICSLLGNTFDQANLDLIENAFECGYVNWDVARPKTEAAINFGKVYKTPRSRMEAICKNIIKNKGKFKP